MSELVNITKSLIGAVLILLRSGLNGSTSNLPDPTGRAFPSSFSAQSGSSASDLNHSDGIGLHSFHGSFNIPNTPGTFASRSSTFSGQQAAGSISNGRFTMNNLPSGLSPASPASSHGHPGFTNNGGRIMNSMGNLVNGANVGRTLSSGGGLNLPGVASRLNLTVTLGTSAPQMASVLGNSYSAAGGPLSQNQFQAGHNHLTSMALLNELNAREHASFDINDFPQLTGHIGSLGGSQGQLGLTRKQSLGFMQQNQEFSMQKEDFPALPGYKGRLRFGVPSPNVVLPMLVTTDEALFASYNVSCRVNTWPISWPLTGAVVSEAGGNSEQLHENVASVMQSQHLPVGRSSGFSLGGAYSSHHQQQQQNAPSVNGGGASFLSTNNQDIFHGSEFYPSVVRLIQARSAGLSASGSRPVNFPNAASGVGSYDQLIQQYQHFQKQSQFRLASPFRDQDLKSTQASQAVADRFGLLGLLSVIRMSNPDLTSLALGIDLMTLGLNLNSSENLHKKFASPWSEESTKGEPHFTVPECFNSKPPPPLSGGSFSKFRPETLFYIFYSMPKEEAQLYAANELLTNEESKKASRIERLSLAGKLAAAPFPGNISMGKLNYENQANSGSAMVVTECVELKRSKDIPSCFIGLMWRRHARGWFYHRELHLWLTRVTNMEPLVKTSTYERGCYFCFDPNTWETSRKDNFVVHYETVEKRPRLPRQ
ncbi:hypothetical protein RJ640_018835 [Escallonia rubra]|uniref:NOT2/NOT3/NOT5 C-terminal domain-containing protein n=1 Tax=Escallonia rubra TaxID=112253 RepID=A0AA88RTG7_9ASTE|nr:hypothetical protein RJ640_018835 [Escallonia rubra]